MIPYLVRVYWETNTALSPARLFSEALRHYDDKLDSESIELQKENLKSVLGDIRELEISLDTQDRLSLTLSKGRILDFIEDYVKKKFSTEGGSDMSYKSLSVDVEEEPMGLLILPYRNIYTMLLRPEPTPEVVNRCLRLAKRLLPSELWVFTWKDPSYELDLRLEPVFIDESTTLFGRLKVVSLSTLFYEIFGRKFDVLVVNQDKLTGSIRISLKKIEATFGKTDPDRFSSFNP
jgi:hypothetical protein